MSREDESATLHERREEVMDELTTHFANSTLSTDEFDERVDLAQRATSLAELEELLVDLDVPGAALVTRDAVRSPAVRTLDQKPRRVLSVLGAVQRKGTWYVPDYLKVSSVMGAIELDFRAADLGPGITEIDVTTVMGAVTIVVPPDLQVECDGHGILGQFDSLEQGTIDPDPDQPLLRITGVAVMAAVEIKVRESDNPRALEAGWRSRRIAPPRDTG